MSESHKDGRVFIGFSFGFFAFGLISYFWPMALIGPREAAVKAGKAEYYLDDKNERQWRWKP